MSVAGSFIHKESGIKIRVHDCNECDFFNKGKCSKKGHTMQGCMDGVKTVNKKK